MPKRKFNQDFIKYGFTSFSDRDEEKGQCIICYRVLSNESLRPSKLQNHLEKNHPGFKGKDIEYFKRLENGLKRQRLDKTGSFARTDKKLTEASFEVSLLIAKQKKAHSIGETLVKASALAMVRNVLGEESERKIKAIPLSDNTVQRKIDLMANDIKEQVATEVNDKSLFGLFALQLDESTDVSSAAQLMSFVRYVTKKNVKEELLFCSELETTTKAKDVMAKVEDFFHKENISWASLCGVCTDGAPAMLGAKSGFQTLVKNKAPNVVTTHCFIHHEALALKTLPDGLNCAFNVVVKSVNFIKNSALNTRLFRKLCEDLNSEHKQLLYYTKVRWLSRGNLVARVFELRDEIKIFLGTAKPELAVHFENVKFLSRLAYLVDIFEALNQLNLKMQGEGKDIIQFVDFTKAFVEKLGNWRRKVANGNFDMFHTFACISDVDDEIRDEVADHLGTLQTEFKSYFPELSRDAFTLVRNPFRVNIEQVDDELQDELIDLKNDSGCRDLFEDVPVTEFWIQVSSSYPQISKNCLMKLLPFTTMWLCESAFSSLLNIKSKPRNRLDVAADIRCALSSTAPRIKSLVDKLQQQPSH